MSWAAERDIYFSRLRPEKKNGPATIESKNSHVLRKYAYYLRYHTPEALALLGQLWHLIKDQMNHLIPTNRPIGFTTIRKGKRRRVCDVPQTPLDCFLASRVLSQDHKQDRLNRRLLLTPRLCPPPTLTESNRNSPALPEHPPCD